MSEVTELGPLTFTLEEDTAVVRLTDPNAIVLEITDDYERRLHAHIKEIVDSGRRVVLDLERLPALSSRQLGLMLTLQKAVSPRQGPLPVLNVTAGVRRVLTMTRTGEFFRLEPPREV
jgi:anti-anti-sigma factor